MCPIHSALEGSLTSIDNLRIDNGILDLIYKRPGLISVDVLINHAWLKVTDMKHSVTSTYI